MKRLSERTRERTGSRLDGLLPKAIKHEDNFQAHFSIKKNKFSN